MFPDCPYVLLVYGVVTFIPLVPYDVVPLVNPVAPYVDVPLVNPVFPYVVVPLVNPVFP